MSRYNDRVVSRTIYLSTYKVYVFTDEKQVRDLFLNVTRPKNASQAWLETQVKKACARNYPEYKYLDSELSTDRTIRCTINELDFFGSCAQYGKMEEVK